MQNEANHRLLIIGDKARLSLNPDVMNKKKYILIVFAVFFLVIVVLTFCPGRLNGYWHGSFSDCLCEDRFQNFIEFSGGNGYLRHVGRHRRTVPDVLYNKTGIYTYAVRVNEPLVTGRPPSKYRINCFLFWLYQYDEDGSAWAYRIQRKNKWDS